MARKMTTQAGGLDIEDGTYRVRLESLEDTEGVFEGKTNALLKWNFVFPEVPTEDGEPGELSRLTSLALSPKSNLWAFYQALTGISLELDMEIDLDDMIGKEAQAGVIHKAGKDGTGSWPHIGSLIALPKTGRKVRGELKADAYEGFRKADGEVDWDNFVGRCQTEGIPGPDVMAFIGAAPGAPRSAIRRWVEAEAGRTLIGLIMEVKRQKVEGAPPVDPDDLPFQ
jgi:hypothetical protein